MGAKISQLSSKVSSRLPPCDEFMANERRKTELVAVLISAVFIAAAITGAIQNGSPSVISIAAPSRSPLSEPPPSGPPPSPVPVGVPVPPFHPIVPQNEVTYVPGELRVFAENGLVLSTGLQSRIIARTNESVISFDGRVSSAVFHEWPDAGACFDHPDGGWVYVSNSEVKYGKGGVGAIYFDANGNILNYDRLLDGTTCNCGGGKTPWGTWITLEESFDGQGIWEVDPFYRRPSSLTALGERQPGRYESFAYDIRNATDPKFFFTEDDVGGALRRFTPNPSSVTNDPNKMWRMLYDDGYKHEYLVLTPFDKTGLYNETIDTEIPAAGGIFRWSDDITEGRESASLYFQNTEGIDFRDGILFFVSKEQKELFALDFDLMTYKVSSTANGAFSEPDQIVSIFASSNQERTNAEEYIIYFTEDGGSDLSGIHARDMYGRYFTILESVAAIPENGQDETTGLAFSPDRSRMYFALQKAGVLYEVRREDGYAFDGMHLDIKYHAATTYVNRR